MPDFASEVSNGRELWIMHRALVLGCILDPISTFNFFSFELRQEMKLDQAPAESKSFVELCSDPWPDDSWQQGVLLGINDGAIIAPQGLESAWLHWLRVSKYQWVQEPIAARPIRFDFVLYLGMLDSGNYPDLVCGIESGMSEKWLDVMTASFKRLGWDVRLGNENEISQIVRSRMERFST